MNRLRSLGGNGVLVERGPAWTCGCGRRGCGVDFACRRRRPIVEVDGGQHAKRRKADTARTARLEGRGYRVVRFWNHEVLENVEGVVEAILGALRERGPPA